jgi:hypothetical protein
MNNGPNIEPGGHLIVSIDVPDTEDYRSVALVYDEEDIGLIVHAPDMYRIIHDLVGLNLLRERIGETDVIKQGFRKFHNGVPCDIATTCHYLTDR